MYILEPSKKIPVIEEADLCVIGGSCTGVFAAVRAARLGLKVVLIEKQNTLGGTAVTGLVNIWHSLYDIDEKEQIIAGLTDETISRLNHRDAVNIRIKPNAPRYYNFNPFELAIVLDEYIKEHNIRVMLHTSYSSVVYDGRHVDAVIVENADGRFAIKAKFFIDASGDGRVARDLHIESYTNKNIQPPSSCFFIQGDSATLNIGSLVRAHGAEFGLEDDYGWHIRLASCKDITLHADNHVFGLRLDRAEDLTLAEIEGRRQAGAFASLIRKYGTENEKYPIVGMCSKIGIRDTVHYKTRFKATADALLLGERYSAPIMNGTYCIDIHHSEDMGITFRYLDGREEIIYGKETSVIKGNWRERLGLSGEPAKYYQVPFDILVVDEYDNFIPVGRMLNADDSAFGALRVMVNLNQMGEAAGVAAYACVDSGLSVASIDQGNVTKLLNRGGSAL